MQVTTSAHDGVIVVEPSGSINMRAAAEFEKRILEHLEGGSLLFVVDFGSVDLITSAGIRVLMMLAQRLHVVHGGLVLCALSVHVQSVFEVAGLRQTFRIVSTRSDALAQVAAMGSHEPQTSVGASKLTRLVGRLIDASGGGLGGPPPPVGTPSALTARVRELLSDDRDGRPSA